MKELRCPNCNGPLVANDTFTLFTCKACETSFADLERGDVERDRKGNRDLIIEKERLRFEKDKARSRNDTILVGIAFGAVLLLALIYGLLGI